MEKEDKLYVECDCGTHVLQVVSSIESHEGYLENMEPCVGLSQDYNFAIFKWGKPQRDWRYRLRIIWRVLVKGTPYDDQLTLSPENANKLADFIKQTSILQ